MPQSQLEPFQRLNQVTETQNKYKLKKCVKINQSVIRSPSKYGISFIAHEVQVLEAQEHKVQVKDSHERKGGHDKNKDQGKPVSK